MSWNGLTTFSTFKKLALGQKFPSLYVVGPKLAPLSPYNIR